MDSGRVSRSSSAGDRAEVMHTFDPWPWQVVGPLIAGVMSSLLLIGKRFGLSSNLRTMCSIAGANRFSDYFKMDWKSQSWNLVFVLGTIAGGAVARFALLKPGPVIINPKTALRLRARASMMREHPLPRTSCLDRRPGAIPPPWLFC